MFNIYSIPVSLKSSAFLIITLGVIGFAISLIDIFVNGESVDILNITFAIVNIYAGVRLFSFSTFWRSYCVFISSISMILIPVLIAVIIIFPDVRNSIEMGQFSLLVNLAIGLVLNVCIFIGLTRPETISLFDIPTGTTPQ